MAAAQSSVFVRIGATMDGSFGAVFSSANQKITALGSAISQLKSKSAALTEFQALQQKVREAAAAFGEAKAKVNALREAVAQTDGTNKALNRELAQAERSLQRMGSALDRQRESLNQSREALKQNGINTRQAAEEQKKFAEATAKAEAAQKRLGAVMRAQQANMQQRGQLRGQMFDAVALGGTMTAPIVAAAQFEKHMLGVAKQVEGARSDGGQLTAVYHSMAKEIQLLGREIPLTTNSIADLVTSGARMGIKGQENLLTFARATAMMAEAFEIPAEEIGDQMGKIAILFGIPIPEIGKLGDVINYLDDNAISKGADIINVLQRIGGTAKAVGMSAKDAAALGSTFLTLGSKAEVAATASNAMIRELSIATMQPKKFAAGLKAIGMNAKDVQKGMAKDATGTILRVLDALNKLPEEKRLEITTKLFGKEYGDDAAKLAGGVAEYRKQLALARGEEAKGSMRREFEARLQTSIAQWQILKNRTTEFAVNIGAILLPTVNAIMSPLGVVASHAAEIAKQFPRATKAVVGTVAGLITLKIAAIGAAYGYTFLKGGVLLVSRFLSMQAASAALASVATLASGAAATTASGGFMGLAATGIAAARTGLTALGTAIIAVLNPMAWLRGASAATSAILAGTSAAARGAAASFVAMGTAALSGALAGVRALGAGLLAFAAAPIAMTVAGVKSASVALYGLAAGGLKAVLVGVRAIGVALVTNPIGIAITAIAAAGLTIYRYWEPIKAFFGGVWDGFIAGTAELMPVLSPLQPLFDGVASAVKTVYDWFTSLLSPVEMTGAELYKVTQAGQAVGDVLAKAADIALAPWRALLGSISAVSGAVGALSEGNFKGVGAAAMAGWDSAFKKPAPVAGGANQGVTQGATRSPSFAPEAAPKSVMPSSVKPLSSVSPSVAPQAKAIMPPTAAPVSVQNKTEIRVAGLPAAQGKGAESAASGGKEKPVANVTQHYQPQYTVNVTAPAADASSIAAAIRQELNSRDNADRARARASMIDAPAY